MGLMLLTVAFTLASGIAGLAFGTYSIYAARAHRLVLRAIAALLLIGPIALLGSLDISVWVPAGYLIGAGVSFVVCDRLLDALGVHSSARPARDEELAQES
jgi:hypothetical protein